MRVPVAFPYIRSKLAWMLVAILLHAGESARAADQAACTTSERTAALVPEEQVRCVLDVYIDATRMADAERARSIFHPDARMSGDLGGGARTGSPEPFFKSLASADGQPGQAGYKAAVSSIRVLGDTAIGDVTEENLFGYNFTNRFHLVKLDGRWQIVSKLYYASRPAKTDGQPPKRSEQAR